MKSRILVAVIWVPVLLYIVLAGPPVLIALALVLLAGIGGFELQDCVSGKKQRGLSWLSGVCAALTVNWYYYTPDVIESFFLLELLIFFGYAISGAER